jgi:hypothetical protein
MWCACSSDSCTRRMGGERKRRACRERGVLREVDMGTVRALARWRVGDRAVGVGEVGPCVRGGQARRRVVWWKTRGRWWVVALVEMDVGWRRVGEDRVGTASPERRRECGWFAVYDGGRGLHDVVWGTIKRWGRGRGYSANVLSSGASTRGARKRGLGGKGECG